MANSVIVTFTMVCIYKTILDQIHCVKFIIQKKKWNVLHLPALRIISKMEKTTHLPSFELIFSDMVCFRDQKPTPWLLIFMPSLNRKYVTMKKESQSQCL